MGLHAAHGAGAAVMRAIHAGAKRFERVFWVFNCGILVRKRARVGVTAALWRQCLAHRARGGGGRALGTVCRIAQERLKGAGVSLKREGRRMTREGVQGEGVRVKGAGGVSSVFLP